MASCIRATLSSWLFPWLPSAQWPLEPSIGSAPVLAPQPSSKAQLASLSQSILLPLHLHLPLPLSPFPPPTTPSQTPVVVWSPSGAIPQADKDQIQARIIDPFIDYYAEQSQGQLLTLTVSVNTQPSNTTYPYLVQAIFDTGTNQGFTIERSSGQLQWWHPDCLGGCEFSAEFEATYPQVVNF